MKKDSRDKESLNSKVSVSADKTPMQRELYLKKKELLKEKEKGQVGLMIVEKHGTYHVAKKNLPVKRGAGQPLRTSSRSNITVINGQQVEAIVHG